MIATFDQLEDMKKSEQVSKTVFELDADIVKEIKNIVKGHKKSSLEILNNLLVEIVNKNVIKVKYTNSDLFVEKMFKSNVNNISTKEFLIPVQFFKDLKYIKKEDTFIFEELDNETLVFTRNNMILQINLADITSYPSFDFLEDDKFNSVLVSSGYNYFEYSDLKILDKATISVSKSESRPSLTQIYLNDNKVVSTDSHRLYQSKVPFGNIDGLLVSPILINKAMDLFDKKSYMKMYYNEYRVKIQDDYTTKIYYTRHTGNYPQTDRLLPTEFNYEIEVKKVKEIVRFLKDAKKEVVKMTLDVNKEKLKFELYKKDSQNCIEIPINVTSFDEREFVICYNAEFFLNGIQQLDAEKFKINLQGKLRPFTLSKINSSKELALILPVRTY